jgi:hypothetical protein
MGDSPSVKKCRCDLLTLKLLEPVAGDEQYLPDNARRFARRADRLRARAKHSFIQYLRRILINFIHASQNIYPHKNVEIRVLSDLNVALILVSLDRCKENIYAFCFT